jgi:hypothetical protein
LHHEVSFNLSAQGDVSESSRSIIVVLDDRRLSVGTPEVNSQELIGFVGLDKDKWVNTISLLESCTIIVRSFLTISPHSPGALVESKASIPFAQSVDLLGVQFEIDLNVLVHQPSSLAFSSNKCLLRVG